jgi:hypothetical protein
MPDFARAPATALILLVAAACPLPPVAVDAGLDAGEHDDAGAQGDAGEDAGDVDAGTPDGGGSVDDAGSLDGGHADGGFTSDAGNGDDGGVADAGEGDAGPSFDAGHAVDGGGDDDGGFLDAGMTDGGAAFDAGDILDAGDGGFVPYEVPERALCVTNYTIPAVDTGALGDPELVETSGLAAALESPGVLFAHNDSGDSARIFVIGVDGAALGQIALEGAIFDDAEDIATAPCPDLSGPCIWLADTGDNTRVRSEVSLYVLPEPAVDVVTGIGFVTTSDYTRYRFTYEGGPVDIEAVTVAADATTVYLFEKLDANSVRAFALVAPFDDDTVGVASVIANFTPPGLSFVNLGRAITAADLHLSGTRLLMRVYSGIYEYRFGPAQGVSDLGSVDPTLITLGPFSEPQGEALAYDESGREVLSVSEDTQQQPGQPMHRFTCP